MISISTIPLRSFKRDDCLGNRQDRQLIEIGPQQRVIDIRNHFWRSRVIRQAPILEEVNAKKRLNLMDTDISSDQ